MTEKLTDKELLYAATSRCSCGAGLAHPLDHELAFAISAWVCSAAWKGEAEGKEHDSYHWAMYKIREETSINNDGGRTTRPAGTVALTVGKATCPQCQHSWESEPYNACGLSHHWFSGPCPKCGYSVGSAGTWRTGEGEAIEKRYRDVVLDATPSTAESQAGQ